MGMTMVLFTFKCCMILARRHLGAIIRNSTAIFTEETGATNKLL